MLTLLSHQKKLTSFFKRFIQLVLIFKALLLVTHTLTSQYFTEIILLGRFWAAQADKICILTKVQNKIANGLELGPRVWLTDFGLDF
jgi:hypothetical protein